MLLQALSWGKDMVAMSGSGPGYMQTIIITPYVHNKIYHVPQMMKKHAVWGRLVDKVFLSIYMSKCMEHGKWITCSSMTDDTNEYIFPKVLVLKNSDYSNRNFLSTIEIPFGEFTFFHPFLGIDEKWWPASVFSPKKQSLGCSHQPSAKWKTPERTTWQEWVKRVYRKKGWSEASEKNLSRTINSS